MMKRLTILVLAVTLPFQAHAWAQSSAPTASEEVFVRATLQPGVSVTLANPLRGTRAIVRIAREGASVRKGDEIVVLDVTDEEIKLRDLELDLALTQSDLTRSETMVEVQKRVAEVAEADALTSVERAEDALTAWKESGYPLEVAAIKGEIELAEAELELASVRLKTLELAPEPRTPEERARQREDQLEARTQQSQARTQLRVNQLKLRHLEEFIFPAKVAKLEADVKLARLRTQRDRVAAEGGIASQLAEQDANKKKASMVREQLEENADNLRRGIIVAPIDGVVVHARSSSRRTTARAMMAGQQVRVSQPLVTIQNLDDMVAIGTCDSESAKRIMLGQKVKVAVDAYPHETFTGKLVGIDSKRGVLQDTVTLRVRILDKKDAQLRPGMSAEFRVITE